MSSMPVSTFLVLVTVCTATVMGVNAGIKTTAIVSSQANRLVAVSDDVHQCLLMCSLTLTTPDEEWKKAGGRMQSISL